MAADCCGGGRKLGVSRGSRSRERIGNGVGTTGMGVGAGDWELAGQEMEVIAGPRFQLQLQVAGAAQAHLGGTSSLATARNALSTTGHRA